MPKKKIAIVSSHFPGRTGVGTAMWNYAQILSNRGHKVYFVTDSTRPNEDNFTSDSIKILEIRPSMCFRSLIWSLGKRIAPFFVTAVSAVDIEVVKFASSVKNKLTKIIDKYHIDTVLFPESFMEFIYFIPYKKCRILITFHCPRYLFQKIGISNAPINRYLNIKENDCIPRADGWIAPSSAMADLAADYYKIERAKIEIIPTPLDIDIFHPNICNKKNDELRICFVGRFSKEKGAEIIIDIIPKLMMNNPQISFTVVGNSHTPNKAKSQIDLLLEKLKSYSLENRFKWFQHLPHSELPDFFRNHSIFVSPTLFESFGISIVEAQACGLPVVVSNVGGVPEVINDGITGFLANLEDREDFCNKLEKLIQDSVLRKKMSLDAVEFVKQKFSNEVIGPMLENIVISN